MSRSQLLGRLSIIVPLGSIAVFIAFLIAADSYNWVGKRGYEWANITFLVLLAAMALSVLAAIVLSFLAWGEARREGRSGWGRLIVGVLCGVVAALFLTLIVWAILASSAAFR